MKHVHGKVYAKKETGGSEPRLVAAPKPKVLDDAGLFLNQNEFLKLATVPAVATYIAFNVMCIVGIAILTPTRVD
jgi:hypothetical protein